MNDIPLAKAIRKESVLKAIENDRRRLEGLGFKVFPLDYPSHIIFSEELRRQLTPLDFRPDFLVLKPNREAFFWEVASRTGKKLNCLLIPYHKLKKYRLWKEKYELPFYLSFWFNGNWLGYMELDQIKVIEKIPSKKRGYVENWIRISLNSFTKSLSAN